MYEVCTVPVCTAQEIQVPTVLAAFLFVSPDAQTPKVLHHIIDLLLLHDL